MQIFRFLVINTGGRGLALQAMALLALTLCCLPAFAQKDKKQNPAEKRGHEFLFTDTLRIKYDPYRDRIFSENATERDDSLQQVVEADLDSIDQAADQVYIPKVTMALLQDRLSCLENQIPLTVNPRVAGFIDYFTVRNRNYTQTMLERRDYYFPLFERKLKEHGLPDELKYLAIVESGLNYAALSRAGALGLWQFMPGTGRDYNLYQDFFRDERMDPEQATEAACRYLKRLHRMFNDWELALASYNAGPGRIIQAQRRTGHRRFWDIYHALPVETRAYVPQFVALTYAVNYASMHNIYPDADSMLVAIPYDSVTVSNCLDLEKLAAATGTTYQNIKLLNPVLRRHATPFNHIYTLRLPKDAALKFMANREAIEDTIGLTYNQLMAYYKNQRNAGKMLAAVRHKATAPAASTRTTLALAKPAEATATPVSQPTQTDASASTDADEDDDDAAAAPVKVPGRKQFYKVRRGENLHSIAQKFDVTVADLRQWNNLHRSQINRGQMLKIYGKAQEAPRLLAVQLKTKDKKKGKAVRRTYTVQPGDTLWAITRKYDGLTVDELVRMNNLHDRKIVPGQKLIVGS